jgi:hypothetical protein
MTLVSELNPTERLRQHTRKSETHNRFFESLGALLAWPLLRTMEDFLVKHFCWCLASLAL